MKEDHKKNDRLRLALRCLPAQDMVPSFDVTDVFLILPDKNVLTLADNMHFFNVIILHYGFL